MSQTLKIYVGYDTREDIAWQVARHSLLRHASSPIEVYALRNLAEVVELAQHPERFRVCGLAAHARWQRLAEQALQWKPDFVHVFVDGRVAEEGGPELAERLEDEGYDRYVTAASA